LCHPATTTPGYNTVCVGHLTGLFKYVAPSCCGHSGIATVVVFTRYGLLVWFPPARSLSPSIFLKNLILVLFDIPIAVLLFTGGTGIVSYTAFANHIANLPLIPYVGIARAKLRCVTKLWHRHRLGMVSRLVIHCAISSSIHAACRRGGLNAHSLWSRAVRMAPVRGSHRSRAS
jgi:hypothetical protein